MQRALIAFLILTILIVVFSIQNAVNVQIKFFFWDIDLPLALIIVISIAMGAILGIFFSIPRKKKEKVKEKSDEPAKDKKETEIIQS